MPGKKLTTAASEPSEDRAIQVEVTLPVRRRRRESRKGGQLVSASNPRSRPRIPRIARLMALAIKFQGMIDRRDVQDYAEIARLGYVTRARLTQIMNLILLAPDIQEEVLGMEGPSIKKTEISERLMRSLAQIALWRQQKRVWAQMKAGTAADQDIPTNPGTSLDAMGPCTSRMRSPSGLPRTQHGT